MEILEEEGDRLKHDIMKKLFSADLPANLLLLLYILVESMENTIDRAEDSADLVRVLAVSQALETCRCRVVVFGVRRSAAVILE